jgi:hypothetical protein
MPVNAVESVAGGIRPTRAGDESRANVDRVCKGVREATSATSKFWSS